MVVRATPGYLATLKFSATDVGKVQKIRLLVPSVNLGEVFNGREQSKAQFGAVNNCPEVYSRGGREMW